MIRTHRSTIAVVLSVLVSATACGDGAPEPDAGRAPEDGGDVPDAGLPDVGDDPDAGLPDGGDDPDAGLPDGGDDPDAGLPDGGDPLDGGPAPGATRYPADRIHSPLTLEVSRRLRALATAHPELATDVFAQIGDSISLGEAFLSCFAAPSVDLGAHTALEPTLDHFLGGDAGGVSPFERESEAVHAGQTAFMALDGDPNRVELELAALSPAFAVIMLGTNDVGWRTLEQYARDMDALVDQVLAAGVVPLLSTIPPRGTTDGHIVQTQQINATLRALAQARRIPLVDLHYALWPLAGHGIREDGVHLSHDFDRGSEAACDLTEAGLAYGSAMRNLVVLEQLHRVRQVVLERAPALDDPVAPWTGAGSPTNPVAVSGLPFADVRNLAAAADTSGLHLDCTPRYDPAGPGFVYRLEVAERSHLSFGAVGLRGATVQLRLVDRADPAGGCLVATDHPLDATLEPGTYDLVVEPHSGPAEGEALVVVVRDPTQ